MNEERWMGASRAWLRLLLHFYPATFRARMGEGLTEEYLQRCRVVLAEAGPAALLRLWMRALFDAARNGPAERIRPASSWPSRSARTEWGRDVRLVVRRVLRAPLFAGSMIGTLALGLGAFAVVFAVVHNVLLAPMPYDDPDDLYYVWRDYTAFFDLDRGWLGGTDVAELQRAGGLIEDAAALQVNQMSLSGRDDMDPVEIAVMVTSANLFDLLGVQPELGRGFAADEGGNDAAAVTVLTHDLWSRLGADPGLIGREIRLDGQPHTVVGVTGPEFDFVRNASLGAARGGDAYVPLDVELSETEPNAGSYAGLVRARPGTTPEAFATAVAAVGSAVDERDFASRGLELYAVPLKADLVSEVRPALVLLGWAGTLLLLVLMLNVGTLLLARAGQREQSFAVSRALGAGSSSLVRINLLEGALLGLLGGVAGTVLAVWGTRGLVALAPLDLPRRTSIAVDMGTATVVVGAGVLIGCLAAMGPAVWAARAPLSMLLGSSAVRGGGGHGRMRRGMVVTQVALSLVLLTAGGLVARSFERLLRADPGFRSEGVLTLRIPISSGLYAEPEEAIAVQDRLQRGLVALPGVTAVGATSALPLSAGASQTTIRVPGAPGNTGEEDHDAPLVDRIGMRPGYMEAMGMRLLAGRMLDERGEAGLTDVVVDHTFAEYFFPSGDPLGAVVPYGGDSLRVVGVVRQARLYDVHADGRPQLYMRSDYLQQSSLSFVVRSERDIEALVPEVRAAVRGVDARLPVADVEPMSDLVGDALRQQHITAVLIGGFSLGALLLAAMGIFGVVSATVTRRKHEMAVRLALGADHGRVLRLVLLDGGRLILLGLMIGVPATFLVGRAARGLLVGVSPTDPLTLTGVGVALGAVALTACYLPARRVLGIEPARSLREE